MQWRALAVVYMIYRPVARPRTQMFLFLAIAVGNIAHQSLECVLVSLHLVVLG